MKKELYISNSFYTIIEVLFGFVLANLIGVFLAFVCLNKSN